MTSKSDGMQINDNYADQKTATLVDVVVAPCRFDEQPGYNQAGIWLKALSRGREFAATTWKSGLTGGDLSFKEDWKIDHDL